MNSQLSLAWVIDLVLKLFQSVNSQGHLLNIGLDWLFSLLSWWQIRISDVWLLFLTLSSAIKLLLVSELVPLSLELSVGGFPLSNLFVEGLLFFSSELNLLSWLSFWRSLFVFGGSLVSFRIIWVILWHGFSSLDDGTSHLDIVFETLLGRIVLKFEFKN